jgi:hypothetical protein
LFEVDGAERSLLRATVASILIAFAVYAVAVPSITALFPSAVVARAIRSAECPTPGVAAAGYHEPSLVFLAGTETRLTDGSGVADFMRQGTCRYGVVENRQERAFLRRAEAVALRYWLIARVEGYNIATGRAVTLAVYRSPVSP